VTAPALDRPSDDPRREPAAPGALDRTLDLGWLSWLALAWVAVAVVAVALRLAGLDRWALAPAEAERAYDAWLAFRGQPPLPGESLPRTAPLFLLLQSFAFFLFGVSDVTARLVPALAGLALIPLALALRPFVGRAAALGMAALAALSPTLVYASRVGTPEMLVGALALGLLVALLRCGLEGATDGSVRRWAVVGGVALGALVAAGPSALTVLLSLGVGVAVAALLDPAGAVRRGLVALAQTPSALVAGAAGLLVTLVLLFTRLLSDPAAIAGLWQTVAEWGRLLAASSTETPIRFYLLALLLYEGLAVLFGLVAALRGGRRGEADGRLGRAVFGGWFVAAFCLWSFSAGRAPEHAVHVALPLVLLGGGVLGELVAALDWRDVRRGSGGLLALAVLGLIVALVAFGLALERINHPAGGVLPAVVVATLVVVPLAYAVFVLAGGELAAGRRRQVALVALLVPALLLAAFTLRSTILLSFYRAGQGTELLAQRTATEAVRPLVERIERLSRDVTLDQGSVRDVPGGHGLVIAADRSVRWPFQWYFREFPDFRVVDPGQAPLAEAQVVIAPDEAGLPEAGYTPRLSPWLNRVPPAYVAPDAAPLLETVVRPSRWQAGADFLLFREGIAPGDPQTVAVGLDSALAARVFPSTGPYNLGDRPGPGTGRGQFDGPLGIAVAPDQSIYVVDQGNARLQRFDADGRFLDAWGGGEGEVALAGHGEGFGPTGVEVGPDGLVYVADTWNHRVVVLSPDGDQIREIGGPPDAGGVRREADTGDDPADAGERPGEFFGPRDVVVANDEIYVSDTGNERIQVFGLDGTFRRLWGGYGTGPDRLIEPVGLAVDGNGRVYVADSGNQRIAVYTPRGEPVAQWPVLAWPAPDPSGARPAFQPYLAFGPDGTLYASSSAGGSVEVFGPDGEPLPPITEVDEDDPLERPIGVAVAANGDLLITDFGLDAVLRRESGSPAEDLLDLLPIRGGADEEEPAREPAVDPGAEEAGAEEAGAAPTSRSLPPPPGQR